MLGGGTYDPTLDGVFTRGFTPVEFFMDECFHADEEEGEGGKVMLAVEVSMGRYVFLHFINVTLTVVSLPVV